jgi:hypothetical protein
MNKELITRFVKMETAGDLGKTHFTNKVRMGWVEYEGHKWILILRMDKLSHNLEVLPGIGFVAF